MPTNDFLPFAGGVGANVLTQLDYAALASLLSSGFSAGTAPSNACNKVWRQSTIMAAVLAQFIVDETGQDAVDDGTIATLLANLKSAIQPVAARTAHAGGTTDAITATFPTPPTTFVDGLSYYVRAASANGTTTPTFTPNSGTLAAHTIVKGNGLALAAGDIAGAGHWLELQYDTTLTAWVLLNPATGVVGNSANSSPLMEIGAGVAANALTLTLPAGGTIDFRNPTLTSGTPNTRNVSAASLTISSGSTLGTVNGVAARIAVLAIDATAVGGGVELAAVNLAGGNNLDETTLITTTAEGGAGAADSANTIYSATARAGVPFRVIGLVDITEATAGTWATGPTLVQGAGGQALAAMSSIGYGQTRQDVTASRAFGVTYYNLTGKPIELSLSMNHPSTTGSTLTVGGVQAGYAGNSNTQAVASELSAIVRPGESYVLTASGSPTITKWSEVR